ncbi:MAG: sulfatase [Candidatus Marinimicrobia bacterium]|nr:sulfatase [Candidatus Neomarinimicrobiota bacterium]
MNRRAFLKSLVVTAAATSLPLATTIRRKPNIIMILVDDLGWTDLGCFGSDFYETPNIDQIARRGVRFSNAYAACTVCSPTRASLLTGKYPARLHVTDWIHGEQRENEKFINPEWTHYLPLKEKTIAEALKELGYKTIHIGKWHLGEKEHYPEKQGFNSNIGGYHKGQPPSYFYPYRGNDWNPEIPTLKGGKEGEFLTDREATEACRFIEENWDRPFFLNLWHYAVHTPLMAPKNLMTKYEQKIDIGMKHNHPAYAGLVESVDNAFGRLWKKLKELNLEKDTIILFTGDNGGLTLGYITDNSPLREGKGSCYEGGVRVPMFIWYDGIQPFVCEEPVISCDFFPTIINMVQDNPVLPIPMDGKNLVPLLKNPGLQLDREAIFWHYPHYHTGGATPYSAIRCRDWKLIKFYETGNLELYHLKNDIGERNDLSEKEPEKTQVFHNQLNQWLKEVNAQMPVPNPKFEER